MTTLQKRIHIVCRPEATAAVFLAVFVLAGASLLPAPAAGQDPLTLEELARQQAEQMLYEAAANPGSSENLAFVGKKQAIAGKMGTPGYVCLPTCDPTDAKFLAIASGAGLVTLSDTSLNVSIGVPAGSSSFEIGFFDGDGAELDGVGDSRWDVGFPASFRYTLYADPLLDGSGATVIAGFPVLSDTMPNDDWIDFTVATSLDAQAPSGNFFYRLEIEMIDVAVTMINLFKVRTSGVASIELFSQPFSYMSNITSLTDVDVLFPNALSSGFTDASCVPDATRACYDGVYRFFLDVDEPDATLSLWDGDLDRGNFDGTAPDTDDPNTFGQPPFATVDTVDEGVASGLGPSTGNPPDNSDPSGFGIFFLEEPTVRYDLIFPDAQVFSNENPSGNQEWENFVISTDPFNPATMDFTTTKIPAGTYEMRVEGVDNSNLNALLVPFRVLCVDVSGLPCSPLRPFLVGDTVFLDLDKDGLQGPGETGIEGVVVNLLNTAGDLIRTTTTDAAGAYYFEVDPGSYKVLVASSNFDAGGALEGLFTTTGGEEIVGDVVDDNKFDFDFGYRGTGMIGDRVWLDQDGNGMQDGGEPGLNGITVNLLDSAGIVIATTTTSGDGDYSFSDLLAGVYTVEVDTDTLPAGVVQSFDLDGLATPSRSTVSVTSGEGRSDVDFGYGPCSACSGKVTELTLQYLGDTPAQVEVLAKRGPTTDVVFSATVQPGEEFTIVGPQSGNHGFFGTLGTEVRFFVNGQQQTKIHTSCSQPIGPGLVSGDFKVLAGQSRHGGLLCPLDEGAYRRVDP